MGNRPAALLKESKQIDFDGVKVPMDKATSLKQGKGKPYNIAAIWFLYQNKNSNYATYSKLATAEGFTRVQFPDKKKAVDSKKSTSIGNDDKKGKGKDVRSEEGRKKLEE